MPERTAFSLLTAFLLTFGFSLTAYAQNERGAAYGILIDNTGSLRPQFSAVTMISKSIVEEASRRGPVSLFSFKNQGDEKRPSAVVTSGTAWSRNPKLLNNYIDSLYVVPGGTPLRDAINSVAKQVSERANLEGGALGDKVIFLITDGEDSGSTIKEEQLLKTLKGSGIRVYLVGPIRELDNEEGLIRKMRREKAVEFLKRVTRETGGRAVFAESRKDYNSLLKELFAG